MLIIYHYYLPLTRVLNMSEFASIDDDSDSELLGRSDSIPSYKPCDVSDMQTVENIIANTKTLPLFWQQKYIANSHKAWNKFYDRNEINFFKDRHYLAREFVELGKSMMKNPQEVTVLLEVGCGVGNTFFPLMEKHKELVVYAVDFAPKAIDFIKNQERFEGNRCFPSVCDIVKDELPVQPNHVDLVTMVFVLSAIPHESHGEVLRKIFQAMKPGSALFLRDYARFDMTQCRLKAKFDDFGNVYCRSDGTLTAYLTREQVKSMFTEAGFVLKENLYHRKSIANRKTGIKMNRVWIQARAYKPLDDNDKLYWENKMEEIEKIEMSKIEEEVKETHNL